MKLEVKVKNVVANLELEAEGKPTVEVIAIITEMIDKLVIASNGVSEKTIDVEESWNPNWEEIKKSLEQEVFVKIPTSRIEYIDKDGNKTYSKELPSKTLEDRVYDDCVKMINKIGRRFLSYRELKGEFKIPLVDEDGKIFAETSLDQIRFWINRENSK
ncbi:MAG: hypothetical protein QM499_01100 [Flavobacteriaceae bacterium]